MIGVSEARQERVDLAQKPALKRIAVEANPL